MRLAEYGAIEGDSGKGVNRQALSDEDAAAWRYLITLCEGSRLEVETDALGNLFIVAPGRDRSLPPVLLGSHLDSQPTGGRFDGAYGVLCALEVLLEREARGDATEHARDVIAVAWMNEEGSRFAPGMMGSMGFAGKMSVEDIRAVRDGAGISVGEALDRHLAAFEHLPHRALGFPIAAYLELHIEQGPVLEANHSLIGVVTGIQGKQTWTIEVSGEAGHSGTLAMRERRDAMTAFARMAAALDAELGTEDDLVKFTIGRVAVTPNAPSVVAERVVFSIDLRHPDNAVLTRLGDRINAICQAHAAPCSVVATNIVHAPSNDFDAGLQGLIRDAAAHYGYRAMPMLSAAGHDARYLAPLAPSAMIFIPSKEGISHNPAEWSSQQEVAAGANVLYATLDAWLARDR
jgi:N-carbamoyl-L-amino-acid hydrolase